MENLSLYQELKAAGCEMDSHESDLYVKATPEARTILARHPIQALQADSFVSQADGHVWLDVPFAFDPFWTAKGLADAR